MHKAPQPRRERRRLIFCPNTPYRVLPIPINTAKRQGPITSPRTLGRCRPCSAKREDHWDMVSSEAPEQSIRSRAVRKSRRESSSFTDIIFSSGAGVIMGTFRKRKRFRNGTSTQKRGRSIQRFSPRRNRNRVERRTVATCPQQ